MRNLGFFICLALLLAAPAEAKNNKKDAEPVSVSETAVRNPVAATEEDALIEVEIPAALEPELPTVTAPRPDCRNPALSDGIIKKISVYQAEHQAVMLIEKRRDILLLKNLKNFIELPVKGFTAKQDYAVANAIIMTKINKGLADADLLLCKSQGRGRAENVYALIYPVGEGHVVDIINFLPGGAELSDFSFILN